MHLTVNVRVVKTRLNKKGEYPIYYRISYDGNRAEVFSGHHIPPSLWDDLSKQIVPGNLTYDAINSCVEADRIKMLRLFSEYQITGKQVNPKELIERFQGKQKLVPSLLKALDQLLEEFKAQIGSEGFSTGRYKRYLVFKGKLNRFLEKKYKSKDFELGKLSNQFIDGFEYYLKIQENLDTGTIGIYLKILKRLIRFAISNEWMDNDPFAGFRLKAKRVDRSYLNESELSTIEGKQFLTERLSVVRDLFIFSCYTGLSYIDTHKLTAGNIIKGIDGQDWLNVSRTKTGEPCRIPLLPKAKEIIDRYKNYPESQYKNKLLPVRANQKLNEYLKEIADLCGIQKHVTFHVARHTFATTVLLNNGMSLEATSKLLGHRNIRTTQIYARMTDIRISDEMNLLSEKLKKKP